MTRERRLEFHWIDWNVEHIAKPEKKMTRKAVAKRYWEMTGGALAEATSAFDEEFVADTAKPLSPEMQSRWERANARLPAPEDGRSERVIAVRLEAALLDRCAALAKKK